MQRRRWSGRPDEPCDPEGVAEPRSEAPRAGDEVVVLVSPPSRKVIREPVPRMIEDLVVADELDDSEERER